MRARRWLALLTASIVGFGVLLTQGLYNKSLSLGTRFSRKFCGFARKRQRCGQKKGVTNEIGRGGGRAVG